MSRKELQPEDLTAICDAREQLPLDLAPLKMELGTLATGDYSIKNLEHIVCVERKSTADIVACCGYERPRFEREMMRLLAYPARMMIICGPRSEITEKKYRSNIHPNSVMGSLLGWQVSGIPIMFADDHAEAGRLVARFLFIAARRRWREAQALCDSLSLDSNRGES